MRNNNLQKTMEIIEKANEIMERDGVTDEVKTLEQVLEKVTGKSQDIEDFRRYSSVAIVRTSDIVNYLLSWFFLMIAVFGPYM